MLDAVIRINFRGSNFRGIGIRIIVADDVISKLAHVAEEQTLRSHECDATSSVKDRRPMLEKN